MEMPLYFEKKMILTNDCKIDCITCKLNSKNNGVGCTCTDLQRYHPQVANDIVENWEKKKKSYKDVFLEKFPKTKDIYALCLRQIFGEEACSCIDGDCVKEWNKEYKGEK